jgi:hypothetical protein
VPKVSPRPQVPVAGEAPSPNARRATPTPTNSHVGWNRVESTPADPSEIPAFLRRRGEDNGYVR